MPEKIFARIVRGQRTDRRRENEDSSVHVVFLQEIVQGNIQTKAFPHRIKKEIKCIFLQAYVQKLNEFLFNPIRH